LGTITQRRRADGSQGYTAQIRLKRDGKIVHSEAETFSTRALAKEWLARREAALQAQRARGEPLGRRMTVAEMVGWYEQRERTDARWGRTKRFELARLKDGPLSTRRVDSLTRQDFIAHIERRRAAGAGPATAGNDLVWLRGVLRTATAVLGVPTPIAALDEAADYLRGERITGKSRQRDRRLSADEERRILAHFAERDTRSEIPMHALTRFALLTSRRQEEITRLRWDDLDRDRGVALLRDVKHPRHKTGNDRTFRLLSEAWAIIDAQPRATLEDGTLEPRIFPFEPKSIGAAWTRAMPLLGIKDLRFHDLRHEATSRLFERGYSIQEVAQFTLHESWATLKRYTHLKPEDVPERERPI
jgi:integrase